MKELTECVRFSSSMNNSDNVHLVCSKVVVEIGTLYQVPVSCTGTLVPTRAAVFVWVCDILKPRTCTNGSQFTE